MQSFLSWWKDAYDGIPSRASCQYEINITLHYITVLKWFLQLTLQILKKRNNFIAEELWSLTINSKLAMVNTMKSFF